MKKFLFFLLTIFLSFQIKAQNNNVDSLIKNLNNNQLYGTCNYVWVLKIDSKIADSLINIGKSVTPKLIELLENPDKGIIAHCVLSKIWFSNFKSGSSFENFKKKGIVQYNYNGLSFYEKDGKMIADKNTLSDNKKKWLEKIRE